MTLTTDTRDDANHQLAVSRQRLIMEALEQSDEIKVTKLVSDLNVSPETIRRDLRVLESKGRLKRVHGGVVALRAAELQTYDERSAVFTAEKQKIADCVMALDLAGKGRRIFLGGGSTMLPIAQSLAQSESANFVTNAMDIAATLNRGARHNVEITGGSLVRNFEVLTGEAMTASVARFRYDVAITSTNAIDLSLGFLEYFESEAAVHRILARQARTYVIVADHSKFGAVADHVTFGHAAADMVVTDREPAPEFCRVFAKAGVELHWPGGQITVAPGLSRD